MLSQSGAPISSNGGTLELSRQRVARNEGKTVVLGKGMPSIGLPASQKVVEERL